MYKNLQKKILKRDKLVHYYQVKTCFMKLKRNELFAHQVKVCIK